MKAAMVVAQDSQLTVIYNVEPGCLGPEGESHVSKFCSFAQKEIEDIDVGFINWDIIPRTDVSLPEIQYKIANKKLSHEKAIKYFESFKRNLDEFEEAIHEKITYLIESYMGR